MALSTQDSSLVGKVLDGRYEILESIGDGGVGAVYRARRVKLERLVAVKVLHESLVADAGFVGRFQREAVAMSRLHHPHCIAVIDFGVHESRPYLVLEHVPGETVRKLVERGRFAPSRAVQVALQLLDALEYFHGHHVIHRDLKSENVMLVEASGKGDFVKVLDFGMAKILTGPGADSQLSKIGFVPGTPSAMAPEQIYQLPPDPRIDIYATGILLYEMLVGRRPFSGTDMADVVKMQLSESPMPPRDVLGANALSAELERVVIRALEKDRVDRFGTAAEMAAAVRRTPEGRALAAPPRNSQRSSVLSIPPWRPKWPARAAVGSAVALCAFGAIHLWPSTPDPSPAPVLVAAAAPAPQPEPQPSPLADVTPPPRPIVQPWLAHRDLAVTYGDRLQHDDAFREVEAAVADNATLAGADPALMQTAIQALARDRVAFVVSAFRSNPRFVDALVEVTAQGQTTELRHAAYGALRALGQEARADLVAMRILDVGQAIGCSNARAAFKQLRASKDPRVQTFKNELRARGRKNRLKKCLARML